jgi:PAS domain S-box-containing protein
MSTGTPTAAPSRRTVEASLLEEAPAAIVVTDRTGKIAFWNGEATALYGWSKREATGRDLLSLMTTQADEADPAYDVLEALAAGHRWSGDLHLRRRDGELVRVRVGGRPLLSSTGCHVGLMFVAVPVDGADGSHSPPADDGDDLAAIGRRIALARRHAGLTQGEVARQLGVTKRSLQGYEAGTVAPYRHLRDLARILGRDRTWFLESDSRPQKGVGTRDLLEVVRRVVREEVLPVIQEARAGGDHRP